MEGLNEKLRTLTATIDMVGKPMPENIEIVNKIQEILLTFIKNKKKKQQQREEQERYKRKLIKLRKLLDKQIQLLDFEDNMDYGRLYTLKQELAQCGLSMLSDEYESMESLLDESSLDIFNNIAIYTLATSLIKENTGVRGKLNRVMEKWKYYYLYMISISNEHSMDDFMINNMISGSRIDSRGKGGFLHKYYELSFQSQFSRYVFYKRKNLNLTQEMLSKMSGVDRSMISKIETAEQKTTMDTAIRLLTSLDSKLEICSAPETVKATVES